MILLPGFAPLGRQRCDPIAPLVPFVTSDVEAVNGTCAFVHQYLMSHDIVSMFFRGGESHC